MPCRASSRTRSLLQACTSGYDISKEGESIDTNFEQVDVRDVAEAHVSAFEKPDAANKRFFVTAGYFSNKEIVQIIKKNFPRYKDLPSDSTPGGDYPEGTPDKGLYKYNNKRSIEVLGLKYKSLEQSIVDSVKSFQAKGL